MTEHERRVHDKTIKAYEQFEASPDGQGVPKMGQNYAAIQQKYIGKAFGTTSISGPGSPMTGERRNLNEVVTVSPIKQMPVGPNGDASLPALNLKERQPSQLVMAGSLNILGGASS